MKRLLFVFICSTLISVPGWAMEPNKVSTEGYCILWKEKVSTDYLNKYSRKLGFTPKRIVCRKINQLIEDFQPINWNYRFGQPFPGSAIRLPKQEVALILARQSKVELQLARN